MRSYFLYEYKGTPFLPRTSHYQENEQKSPESRTMIFFLGGIKKTFLFD
jgi:hypothetical protein